MQTALHIDEFLRQNRDADVLRFTTAGSVDDGKSTMIGRLLSDCKCIYEDHLAAVQRDSKRLNREEVDLALLTDGLKAEREQGITIDVAYRYFSTPQRRFIIADTPGHEQYTRNMVTGASTANLAVILIDARNGVLTQSKRHGFIASLLDIPHVIVAVNKMDLVGYAEHVFDAVRKEYNEFLAKLSIPDLAYIPISALRGDNIVNVTSTMPWYEGVSLLNHLENVEIGGDRNLIDMRFPVQCVNRPNQNFRGYCGALASGVVRVGDKVMALPSGKTSRVKAIVTYDGNLDYAFPPMSVTLCLEDELDVSRGDMLVHPGNQPTVSRDIDAMLVWMSEAPLRVGQPYIVKHTTNSARGVISELHYRVDPNNLHRLEAKTLGLNEIARVSLSLFKPLLHDAHSRNRATGSFIVVDMMTNETVGAGMIIERKHVHIRAELRQEEPPRSLNINRESSLITAEDRARILRQDPVTVWLTGLSGSGKSTIARHLEKALIETGSACYMLDGDNIRHGLNRDLGFSDADRTENIRRIAETAGLFNHAGLIVVTSFISPFRQDRHNARLIVGEDRFIEVFVDAPLDICEQRDPKGLYKKARAGQIEGFTGVDAPYEAPEQADITVDTTALNVGECVAMILTELRKRGIVRQ